MSKEIEKHFAAKEDIFSQLRSVESIERFKVNVSELTNRGLNQEEAFMVIQFRDAGVPKTTSCKAASGLVTPHYSQTEMLMISIFVFFSILIGTEFIIRLLNVVSLYFAMNVTNLDVMFLQTFDFIFKIGGVALFWGIIYLLLILGRSRKWVYLGLLFVLAFPALLEYLYPLSRLTNPDNFQYVRILSANSSHVFTGLFLIMMIGGLILMRKDRAF